MSLLFRNRWFALLWLALTVASASFFVGDDGGAAKLLASAEQIRAQRQSLHNAPPASPRVFDAEPDNAAMPVLLPAGDVDADPLNPKPGDEFIDGASGRRVQIVGRDASAAAAPAEAQ